MSKRRAKLCVLGCMLIITVVYGDEDVRGMVLIWVSRYTIIITFFSQCGALGDCWKGSSFGHFTLKIGILCVCFNEWL